MTRWITLRMPYESARELQHELSELTSWCRGFTAAGGPNRLRAFDPLGTGGAGVLNSMLKDEIRKVDGMNDEEEPIF